MSRVITGCALLLLFAACSDDNGFTGPLDAAPPPADIAPDSAADLLQPDLLQPDLLSPDLGWPSGCANEFKGKTGQALKTAIWVQVNGHKSLGYSKARDAIFLAKGGGIDRVGDKVEGIYTGRVATIIGSSIPSDMNVEHSWPQSKGASKEPAKSDLHHLFPSDSKANSRRGNYDFGEPDCTNCSCSWSEGGSTLGYKKGCGERVFKVRAARKGDIARAQFYFALRYSHDTPAISAEVEKVLRAWAAADPATGAEVKRNDAIETKQENRNPFVDCPILPLLISDF